MVLVGEIIDAPQFALSRRARPTQPKKEKKNTRPLLKNIFYTNTFFLFFSFFATTPSIKVNFLKLKYPLFFAKFSTLSKLYRTGTTYIVYIQLVSVQHIFVPD
ncbi:hypothetical protein AMTRI_Chr02g217160 [Amborella trichopoda]